ncbi:MAG: MSEP-CTERM sorting domain-containing protein, partial [Bacteroidota bacterium]
MKNLLNPKWIFIVHTLPVVLLSLIFFGEYQIIHTLLDEESLGLWRILGVGLMGLIFVNFAYGLFRFLRGERVSIAYAILALPLHIGFIYWYFGNLDQIIPWTIPRWMIAGDFPIYVGTFLMPSLAYCLFVLVTWLTPKEKEHKVWKSFGLAIAVPINWYIFGTIILPLWRNVDFRFSEHVFIVLFIVSTLVFIFFLVRGLYVLTLRKIKISEDYELAGKIILFIVLPLLGLLTNNTFFFTNDSHLYGGVLGDFNHYSFYVLALLNGIALCLPSREDKVYRLGLFVVRSVTFSFIFYFFLVTLPFLPFSIIAILAVGLGFLLMLPLAIFVFHVIKLSEDFSFLKAFYPKNILWLISGLGFLLLPTLVTLDYYHHRQTLHEVLEYVYEPDFEKAYDIDKKALEKTIQVVEDVKGDRFPIFSKKQPYLSAYFNWIVLDNLTLSNAKIKKIRSVFFGGDAEISTRSDIKNPEVKISNLKTQ